MRRKRNESRVHIVFSDVEEDASSTYKKNRRQVEAILRPHSSMPDRKTLPPLSTCRFVEQERSNWWKTILLSQFACCLVNLLKADYYSFLSFQGFFLVVFLKFCTRACSFSAPFATSAYLTRRRLTRTVLFCFWRNKPMFQNDFLPFCVIRFEDEEKRAHTKTCKIVPLIWSAFYRKMQYSLAIAYLFICRVATNQA